MQNLKEFCHYHIGDAKDKTIKIAGGVLIVMMLLLLSYSTSWSAALDRYMVTAVQEVPEPAPAPPIIQEAPPPTQEAPSPPQDQGQPPPPPPSQDGGGFKGGPQPVNVEQEIQRQFQNQVQQEIQDQAQQQFEAQQALVERVNVLRDIKQQLRELKRLCTQLKRLNGAADDAKACLELGGQIVSFQDRLKAAKETDEIREVTQEYWQEEFWEKINAIRRKVELPRELNQILKELNRLKKMLVSRQFSKLGLNMENLKAKAEEMSAQHTQAKEAYAQGDFEAAEEILQDLRQNHPGNIIGFLHTLRSIKEQLRRVRDKDFKAEVESLLTEIIALLDEGEFQEANESLMELQRELAPLVWKKILSGRGAPDSVLEKIQAIKEKIGEGGNGERGEGPGGFPPGGFPPGFPGGGPGGGPGNEGPAPKTEQVIPVPAG